MAISDVSLSFLTQTSTTFEPPLGLLNPGEGFVNSADGRLWIGSGGQIPLEIGLNSRSGIISDTGKYLTRRSTFDYNTGQDGDGYSNVNRPYNPLKLGEEEYYEFYIRFVRDGVDAFVGGTGYTQPVNWGSIPDPLPLIDQAQQILVKFFRYGFGSEWLAIPVWSDDSNLNLFKGSDAKFSYTEIISPTGNSLPRREKLKFQSLTTATVSDDAGNDTTVVELGRNLVTRIVGQPTVSLDYNLSEFYIFDGTTSLDLPGGSSPTEPFQFILKNINSTPITINNGSLSTLSLDETALILYDGVNYNHVIYGASGTRDELVGVSANDTTPGFLLSKLVAGTNISLTENNDGGNETLTIDTTNEGVIPYQTTGVAPTSTPPDGALVLDHFGGTTTLYARSNGSWVTLLNV